jgi:acyl homoserine lactone synthase
MFVTIQAHELADNAALLDLYFRLRKRVFYDGLRWDVPVQEDRERDAYDDEAPAYLVWCNEDRTVLYGAVRLLPTTGPTLLHDVFHETHGCSAALIAPDIWEVTRMCIDTTAIAADFDGVAPARAVGFILLALCECAIAHGIACLVSNFEACMKRTYRLAGLEPNILGSAGTFNRRPVYCGSFDISTELLSRMRSAVGIDVPVYQKAKAFCPLIPAMAQIAA